MTTVPAATGMTLAEATSLLHAAGAEYQGRGPCQYGGAVAVAQSSPEGERCPRARW